MANEIVFSLVNQHIQQMEVCPSLRNWFEYYWQVNWEVPVGQRQTQRILTEPKADLFIEEGKEGWEIDKIRKSVFEIHIQGKGAVFGVRCRPATQRLLDEQEYTLPRIEFNDFAQSAERMDQALLALDLPYSEEMESVNRIVDAVASDPSIVLVSQILEKLSLNERKAQRWFTKYIGLSIKGVICRYRAMEAVRQVKEKPMDWASLAIQLGYSDQAHFIRDFKSHCLMTPNEYHRCYQKHQE